MVDNVQHNLVTSQNKKDEESKTLTMIKQQKEKLLTSAAHSSP